VPSVIHSQELEVPDLLQLASSLPVHGPFLVGSGLEVLLAGPFNGVGPGLAASPVADEVFVARVDQNFDSRLDDGCYFLGEVCDPVAQEEGVDCLGALDPSAA
jgi:hypothetical protein